MKTIVAKDLFIEAMRMAPEARAAWLAGLSEDNGKIKDESTLNGMIEREFAPKLPG